MKIIATLSVLLGMPMSSLILISLSVNRPARSESSGSLVLLCY